MVTRQKSAPTGATPAPDVPSRRGCRLLVIEARFYENIADELLNGAIAEMEDQGVKFDKVSVPGALEIPQVLALAVANGLIPSTGQNSRYLGAVALGCVIRGETSHYDTVCNNANHWLMDVAIRHHVPLGNAILTVENEEQALVRARGGRDGKGGDAVRACLQLVDHSHAFAGQGS